MEENKNIEETELRKMFPHIVGYTEIRQEAAQIVDLFQNEKLYHDRGAHYPRGWIFYGKPGTGKSRLVLDIATYLSIPLIEISASDAIERKITVEQDIYFGFKKASESEHAILFIDEIEKIAGYRKFSYEIPENLKYQKILLHELDKISSKQGVIVIATCNDNSYLGDALKRSGRFDRKIFFPIPNSFERKAIIEHFLEATDLPINVSIDEIVKMTGGFSGADIECLVNETIIKAVSKRKKSLGIDDFTYAIRRVSFEDLPKESASPTKSKKATAYHEAGHAYMIYRLTPENLGSVSILCQGGSQGSAESNAMDVETLTLKTGENLCMIGLGGMFSAKMMTGDFVGGNVSDLKRIKGILNNMLDEGFYGLSYLNFGEREYSGGAFSMNVMNLRQAKMGEIINILADRAMEMLKEGKNDIEKLATELVEKNSLSSKEVLNILGEKE